MLIFLVSVLIFLVSVQIFLVSMLIFLYSMLIFLYSVLIFLYSVLIFLYSMLIFLVSVLIFLYSTLIFLYSTLSFFKNDFKLLFESCNQHFSLLFCIKNRLYIVFNYFYFLMFLPRKIDITKVVRISVKSLLFSRSKLLFPRIFFFWYAGNLNSAQPSHFCIVSE